MTVAPARDISEKRELVSEGKSIRREGIIVTETGMLVSNPDLETENGRGKDLGWGRGLIACNKPAKMVIVVLVR